MHYKALLFSLGLKLPFRLYRQTPFKVLAYERILFARKQKELWILAFFTD